MRFQLSGILNVLTIVLVIGIVAVVALFGTFLLDNDRTPTTELERAVVAAEEAVRANPEDANARIKLAAAYLESGALAAAEEQASVGARLAPTDPSAQYALGLVYSKRGDNEKAIATLTKAANMEGQLAGFYQDVYAALAQVYQRNDQADKALESINGALDFGPENALLLIERAKIYEAEELWADALYDYQQARSYSPDLEEAVEGATRVANEHPESVEEAKQRFEEDNSGSSEPTDAPTGDESTGDAQ